MASSDESLFSEVGKYILENQNVHDCFFILGEEKKRIGAAKLFLINQSRVWWSMLSEESDLAEKGDIKMPDIEPEVFILLLKYCYGGLKDFFDVSDDMMLKLCYCANKYLMTLLMEKIADRLKPTSVENLFPALHALTFFNLKGIEDSTEKIVQCKTDQIFIHPEFLECHVESVTYIAKQETLNCEEIDLWKALVAWAKHKAGCEDGSEFRKFLLKPLQHIQFLTMDRDVLCDEVLITEALTVTEISSILKKNIASHVKTLSSKLEKRSKPEICLNLNLKSEVVNIIQVGENRNIVDLDSSVSILITKNTKMLLKAITCAGYILVEKKHYFGAVEGNTTAVVTISCLSSALADKKHLEPVVVNYNPVIRYYQHIRIPLSEEKKVVLLQNSRYEIKIKFNKMFSCWEKPNCDNGHDFEYGTFYCFSMGKCGTTHCHILQIEYVPL